MEINVRLSRFFGVELQQTVNVYQHCLLFCFWHLIAYLDLEALTHCIRLNKWTQQILKRNHNVALHVLNLGWSVGFVIFPLFSSVCNSYLNQNDWHTIEIRSILNSVSTCLISEAGVSITLRQHLHPAGVYSVATTLQANESGVDQTLQRDPIRACHSEQEKCMQPFIMRQLSGVMDGPNLASANFTELLLILAD